MSISLTESFSPLMVFVIFFTVAMLFFEIGFFIGKWRKRVQTSEEKVAEPMIGGVLGLLAFVLAFSFNIASGHYETRKQNVLEDANAISTAFLRADLITEPQRSAIKSQLIAYTQLRADLLKHQDNLPALLNQVEAVQIKLWKTLAGVPPQDRTPLLTSLSAALTSVFDIHEKRINDAIYNRMGNNIWFIIFSITFLSTFMLGVRSGFTGKKSYVTLLPFISALTLMIYLITDLDVPQRGLFRVSQQPIFDTLLFIEQYDEAPAPDTLR